MYKRFQQAAMFQHTSFAGRLWQVGYHRGHHNIRHIDQAATCQASAAAAAAAATYVCGAWIVTQIASLAMQLHYPLLQHAIWYSLSCTAYNYFPTKPVQRNGTIIISSWLCKLFCC
jgi:hypothetical protein